VAVTGFLPGVLSFLCALSHLERIAHRPTSHTQSSTVWPQQPTGKTDTGFPKLVQQSQDGLTITASGQGLHAQARSVRQRMHRLSKFDTGSPRINTVRLLVQRVYGVYSYRGRVRRIVHQIGSNEGETPITTRFNSFHCHYNIVPRLWVRDCVTNNSRRGRHRLHSSEQRCTGSSEQTQAFPRFRIARGSLAEVTRFTLRIVQGRMEEEPPNTARLSLLLHAPGLTLVTHATACSFSSSHHLENHMSFQKDLG
jgi:hypothetical protein